jgi:hypothetical protein
VSWIVLSWIRQASRAYLNIHLEFGLDESIRAGVFGGGRPLSPPPDIEKGPSIFTALEQQLGLKLD